MIRVGVLRGGTSAEYDRSLTTGAYVLKHLPRDRYEVLDIFLDRDGVWHLEGTPVGYEKLVMRVDVVWNALHGFYGEDGKVQQLLETLGIPYVGSGPLSSAIAMNRKLANDHLAKAGIKTPRGMYIEEWGTGGTEETVRAIVQTAAAKFSPPWIVHTISRGEGIDSLRVKTRDELSVVLAEMCAAEVPILIEEAVLGKTASVIGLNGFRGKDLYTFIPMQTESRHVRFHPSESEDLQRIAKRAHEALSLGQYLRMEAIVTPKGHIYVTSIETIPLLHDASELDASLAAVGSSFGEFSGCLIEGAVKRR